MLSLTACKKILLLGLILGVTLYLGLSLMPSAQASGLNTSTTDQPGQVRMRNEDGILYLTTDTVPGGATTTSSRTNRNGGLNLITQLVSAPEGFARDFGALLNSILSFVMVIAALLVFLYLVWGAFDWITSGGDKGKTQQARQKIVAAVIGLIIVAASYAVLNLVIRFLGFNNFNDVLDNVQPIDGSGRVQRVDNLGDLNATPSASPTPTLSGS